MDCSGKVREVSVANDIKNINRFGGNIGSKFNGQIKKLLKNLNKLVQHIQ